MKPFWLALLLLSAGCMAANVAAADTLAYPTADNASFLLDYPSSWELTPGEAEGDYMSLLGTSGTGLMFRTLAGEDIEQAVKDTLSYVHENYTDVALSEPKDSLHRGLKGFTVAGAATDSESTRMRIGMAWFQLNDGSIGEIWFSAPEDDKEGIAEAAAVIDSFRAPD